MRDDVHKLVIPYPLKVQIHPTNRCNLNCNFCWLYDEHHRDTELSDHRRLQIADLVTNGTLFIEGAFSQGVVV